MVQFANSAKGQGVANWWESGNNQIAFSRGNKAFIAFNNEGYGLNADLQTGLPSGTYCDVGSGQKNGGSCTGASIQVGGDGRANINLAGDAANGFIAIHADSKL